MSSNKPEFQDKMKKTMITYSFFHNFINKLMHEMLTVTDQVNNFNTIVNTYEMVDARELLSLVKTMNLSFVDIATIKLAMTQILDKLNARYRIEFGEDFFEEHSSRFSVVEKGPPLPPIDYSKITKYGEASKEDVGDKTRDDSNITTHRVKMEDPESNPMLANAINEWDKLFSNLEQTFNVEGENEDDGKKENPPEENKGPEQN